VRYYEHGGPEVLRVEEVDVPAPGPGQVLIRVEAIGASYIDTVMRSGTSVFGSPPLPGSPHGDVVGTVAQLGAGAAEVRVGDRVGAFVVADAYADCVVADADWLVPIPDGIDLGVASTLSMPGPVALGTLRAGRLAEGETVLVHSGAGGIGQLAVQLAKIEGAATVIATAGSADKLAFVQQHGADAAVSYRDADWADQVSAIAPGGVDLILDAVGGQVTADGLGLLAPLGRNVLYGAGSNTMPILPGDKVVGGMRTVSSFSFMGWRAARPDAARAEVADLLGYAAAGRLHVAVQATVPLADAAEAHRLLADRARVGRVLLVP
jgi:NADPH:quinone reductase-like Zn-dependent oxidoreductase